MDGAAGAVAGELGEVQRLGHDALAGERGVAVDEERDDFLALGDVAEDALAGAGLALHDRIDGLEVRGVGGHAQADGGAAGGGDLGLVTEVVLHIAVAGDGVGKIVLRELLEDELVALAEDAGQHGEAAAVGHAHDDLLHAERRAELDQGIEERDEGLAAFESEALLPEETGVEETLEGLRLVEPAEDAQLLRALERGLVEDRLHARLQPAAHIGVLDVEVLDAHVAAVGAGEAGDEVAQLHRAAGEIVADVEGAVEVVVAEAEFRECQTRGGGGGRAERIEVRLEVADRAVVVDEAVDERLLAAGPGGIGLVRSAEEPGGVAVGGKGEPLEEGAPVGVDGAGVVEPSLVVLVDEVGVERSGERGAHGADRGKRIGRNSWATGRDEGAALVGWRVV